ncbi:hypothetical protein A2865_02415 [Candidatus Woesebacteria bacterium RIFCSPHIGHO2_01_FULL_39_17]|uniref:DUF304 domain-containing protein n=3 Tax=Candidatus Woeseibacteriota TaxID=1752722 RepID=A0A0G0NKU5_9BACT|nr:MAG: hypothetical protein US72_C0004G0012 [Microgenomates group bacterium GW2011_GWC1_38_12]KKQ93628.1 MAG: hypothetical protein UT19_C0009G0037 [Candidatus Woesebacteria bacterium GW2011_GWB1_39_10b]KKR13451.1 MAG: hypothetical protein UT40_C0017G0037 [Candidatus Woesebacteria bacterium GW2011_GWA1_39_21b]OGM24102.1 MAG: hypothetical protein A2865_02415 [Candidatus Woesebacteria bacterium RIFCSPHIGHO2_01_FULL_39_17]OGM62878.1 MAG: hypothetical protein A3A52_03625 [Candidatus Woesebacteria b
MPDVFISEEKTKSSKLKSSKTKPFFVEPKESERHRLPGHTHNPLAAFCYYPDFVRFVNADPEEKVVLLLRRHPITNLQWLVTAFLMLLAPSFFPIILPYELLPPGFQIILPLVWYLITFAFILEKFLSWFFHVNIVTDERIIEVDFFNLVSREITDANIDQIQDVTPRVVGSIRTFFNFGDVVIQTAASIPLITFEAVPNPDKVARILRESRIEEEQEKLEGRVR